jgi:hypothetical protein
MSKGGDIITINKNEVNETRTNIDREMPMFKNKLYMKKINDPKYADRKNIHYVGKFILGFEVELSTYTTELLGKNSVTCKIHLVATEMEIKHNVSHCNSLLSKDLISINIKNEDITSVTI